MPDHAADERPPGTYLGFDFGLRRIGVAVGESATRSASPLVTVQHGKRQPDWEHVQRLVREWRPVAMVVGLPLGRDAQETPLSANARGFARQLRKRCNLPVFFCDERLTSQAAAQDFAAQRAAGTARRRDAGKLDAVAASIILENWLQASAHD